MPFGARTARLARMVCSASAGVRVENGRPERMQSAGGKPNSLMMAATSAAGAQTARNRRSSIEALRWSTKAGLVSSASRVALAGNRASAARVNTPVPGPYSTNSFIPCQSSGASMLRTSLRLAGKADPTIAGWERNVLIDRPSDGLWSSRRPLPWGNPAVDAIIRTPSCDFASVSFDWPHASRRSVLRS